MTYLPQPKSYIQQCVASRQVWWLCAYHMHYNSAHLVCSNQLPERSKASRKYFQCFATEYRSLWRYNFFHRPMWLGLGLCVPLYSQVKDNGRFIDFIFKGAITTYHKEGQQGGSTRRGERISLNASDRHNYIRHSDLLSIHRCYERRTVTVLVQLCIYSADYKIR